MSEPGRDKDDIPQWWDQEDLEENRLDLFHPGSHPAFFPPPFPFDFNPPFGNPVHSYSPGTPGSHNQYIFNSPVYIYIQQPAPQFDYHRSHLAPQSSVGSGYGNGNVPIVELPVSQEMGTGTNATFRGSQAQLSQRSNDSGIGSFRGSQDQVSQRSDDRGIGSSSVVPGDDLNGRQTTETTLPASNMIPRSYTETGVLMFLLYSVYEFLRKIKIIK